MNIGLNKMKTRAILSKLHCAEGVSQLWLIWKEGRARVSRVRFYLQKPESGM